ncbi:hypothetical protein EVAR_84466_1 [Eumeta japonica]|uniref:non-specific serine/threonine protein kinase n=1 Tax=Eumeta variegata TaxID=151549 RepID=A0A4C1X840_EUMVA|nr:hypothetical protein EVAR_84466_1 [Eumeta japonica]
MSVSEIADFLQPKFLGVLAYFHTKLVRNKGALSGKRKALQSFPDIMNLMGAKHVTPLRFKILASLRSGLSLGKEYPKILSSAWSAFVHNIDTISLGPFLATLAVSLLDVYQYAPHEVNKIFQYLVLRNENLLSAHIPDLFFLEDSKLSDKVKLVIKRHVQRTQPNRFLEKIKWYLQRLHQDIPNVKIYAFTCLDEFLKNNRAEIDMAIFGGKNIDPVMVELIDCLLLGCKDPEPLVSLASGSCLGQLGAIEAGHLPRQYVQPDRSPFAFSISDDCFAATALLELARAFQYEKYTENMDYYAFTIQEMLKIYNISPTSDKKDLWNSLPENMQHVIKPLLNSRYTLMTPQQTKKPHPIFGSACGTSFLEWAHRTIKAFLSKFNKLVVIRGNIVCGEFERALQYLELYMEEYKDEMQEHLSLLTEIYALLDEPDSVAGVLSIKRSEPSLNELILVQVVTGRLQDAALCYERLAQEGLLDKNSMQGMVDCYLGLDQPYTAYQLLSSHDSNVDGMSELAAEPLWRLGNFDQLQEIVNKPIPPSRENWGLIMGRILLSFRSQNHEEFERTCEEGMKKLLAKLEGEGDCENVLHSGYQSVLGLHIIKEASLAEEVFVRLKGLPKNEAQSGSMILSDLLEEWRHRLSIVQSDVRTVEPVLRCRRILLQQMQKHVYLGSVRGEIFEGKAGL